MINYIMVCNIFAIQKCKFFHKLRMLHIRKVMRKFLDSVPEFLHLVQVPGACRANRRWTQMSSAEPSDNSKFAHNYFCSHRYFLTKH